MALKGKKLHPMAYKEYHDTEEEVSRPRAMTERIGSNVLVVPMGIG
jgi:hypothetical protein